MRMPTEKQAGNMRKRAGKLNWIGAALLMLLLSACSFGLGGEAQPEEDRVLRIATLENYGNNYTHIRQQYTDLYDFSHDHIELEFVSAFDSQNYNWNSEDEQPDPVEEMKQLMQSDNPPDVVMLNYHDLPAFIEENLLESLDPLIAENDVNLDDFAPTVLEGLRSAGNGELYALAPTFSSSALVYNRTLFNETGTPLPEDGMTWDDVFVLAKQMSGGEGEDKTFGFSFQRYYYFDPYSSMFMYSAPLELSMLDETEENMTVDNPAWADVWNTIVDLYESGVFPEEPDRSNHQPGIYNPFEYDAFLSGKLAMTVMNYQELHELINVKRNVDSYDGLDPIEWDVVTYPVHPEKPEIGGQVYLDYVFAINARAGNREDAWDLIEFIHSEDWARIKSRSSVNMVSRTSYIEPIQGEDYNVEAFYQLLPSPSEQLMYDMFRRNPELYQVEHIGRMKFNEVIQGDKTVEEALAEWQTEGNSVLQQIRENSGNDGGGSTGGVEVLPAG